MKLISQIAKESDIPVATVRFYEKLGLFSGVRLPEVKSNNYTWYSDDVLQKLEFIQDAKSTGFTLAEIKEIIDAWCGNKMSKKEKLAIFDKKILQIDEKIKELKNVKKQIDLCKKDV